VIITIAPPTVHAEEPTGEEAEEETAEPEVIGEKKDEEKPLNRKSSAKRKMRNNK